MATKESLNKLLELKPYNRYNLFFILERERILQSHPKYDPSKSLTWKPRSFLTGYENLELPPGLPARYAFLELPMGWYLPGKSKNRVHKKTHGLVNFADISRSIASAYKSIDDETFTYLDQVSKALHKRRREIKAICNLGRFTATPSTGSELNGPSSGCIPQKEPPTSERGKGSIALKGAASNQKDQTGATHSASEPNLWMNSFRNCQVVSSSTVGTPQMLVPGHNLWMNNFSYCQEVSSSTVGTPQMLVPGPFRQATGSTLPVANHLAPSPSPDIQEVTTSDRDIMNMFLAS